MSKALKTENPVPPNMMARIYIHQARLTKWMHWKASLLTFAGKQRAKYFEQIRNARMPVPEIAEPATQVQAEQINQHGQWSLF